MKEPDDHALCVWYLPGTFIPFVVMVRIDEYEDAEAPGERWFAADLYFTWEGANAEGYTWQQVTEMFPQYEGPYLFHRKDSVKLDD